jgi:ADP-ribosylglycohydrolase
VEDRELLRKRIKGALIGVAYGDSFGMPVEMWSGKRIASAYGKIQAHLPGNCDNFISKGLAAYEVTDDTINTALVIDMLYENHGQVNAMMFIRMLKHWAETSEKSSAVIGPSTAKAIARIELGVPMEETGITGTTNGAAMKILPLGLIHDRIGFDELIGDVRKLCIPTHNTSSAISGAAAVAAAACYGVNGGRDLGEMITFAQKAADAGKEYGNQIGAPSISARLELVRQYIKYHTQVEAQAFLSDIIGTGLPVEESAVSAISFAWISGGDPLICAEYAVNAGGDTDTVAAMACGICGALRGEEAFDHKVVRRIEETNGLSFDHMTEKLMTVRDWRCKRK